MEHNISSAKYVGYIWFSDQTKPQVFDGTTEHSLTLTDGENPFVVEGRLWDNEKRRSVSIKFVDERYIVSEYMVTEDDIKDGTVSYIAHRINGVRHLKFLRIWRRTQDHLCEDMDTLQLQNVVFVGFEK